MLHPDQIFICDESVWPQDNADGMNSINALSSRKIYGIISPPLSMTGGHGEWFVQDFTADGSPSGKVISLPPAQAAERPVQSVIAGSKAEELHALLPLGSALSAVRLPDARHALELDPALLRDELAPLYGRPPDAKLPG